MASEFTPKKGLKLPDQTASRALTTDANSKVTSSSVTSTELGYVSGVTSAIQTQLNTNATNLSNHESDTSTHGVGEIVGRTETQTLTNKTIDTAGPNTIKVNGNTLSATAGTATVTIPNSTDTLVGKATTDTLTNKTIDTAGPNTIKINGNTLSATAGTATVTIPNSTDTLVGKATTDTLTNKTISAGVYTGAIDGSASTDVDLGTSNSVTTIDIGTGTGANTINLGGANTTINMTGTVNNQAVTNLNVSDKLITINDGGAVSSGGSAGIEVEENGSATAYVQTSSDRNSWKFKAPNTNGITSLTPGATDDTVVLAAASQTLTNKTLTAPVISTISNTGTITLPTSTDTLVGKATTDTLTNKTLTSPTINTPTVDVMTLDGQASTPSNPSSGYYKAYVKDSTQKLTILDSAGVETTVGSGSGTNNYITANDGTTIGDWVTYADAAASSPVDGTGGSPSSTFAVSTSSTMRGTTNFLFTHSAANRQGEGFSYTMAIDPSDRGKVLRLSFDYLVASGTYADNDLVIYFYDVTNSALIQGAPYQIKNSSIIERFDSEVQVPSSCASLRVIFHVATSTATAYTMRFDDFIFAQQAKLYGSPITDEVSYTPTISNFTLGNGTQNFYWSRHGDRMFIRGDITLGSTSSITGTIAVSLPSGYSIASRYTTNNSIAGARYYDSSTTVIYNGAVRYSSSTAVDFYTILNSTVTLWNATTPVAYGTGDIINFEVEVPITGWSSSVVMSSDADTRVVAMRYSNSSSQAITTGSNDVLTTWTKVTDTHNAMNPTTGVYTIPVSGYYKVSANIISASTAWTVGTNKYVGLQTGGTQVLTLDLKVIWASITTLMSMTSSTTPAFYNAGDTISITINNQSGSTFTLVGNTSNWVSIERVSGPAQIAASETVAGRYNGSATAITGALGTITYTNKDYDSHGAYSGGVLTIPVSGKYRFNAKLFLSHASVASLNHCGITIYKNNSTTIADNYWTWSATAPTGQDISVTDTVNLLAGDTIRIQAYSNATTPSIGASTTRSYFTWEKVGNY